mmetsp:Transcript_34634/g.92769  ORF Transcript_34634/g.92769 Transcript_34634/m.92769 type:complete len:262 (-) Transcript_34634:294-1079(-)
MGPVQLEHAIVVVRRSTRSPELRAHGSTHTLSIEAPKRGEKMLLLIPDLPEDRRPNDNDERRAENWHGALVAMELPHIHKLKQQRRRDQGKEPSRVEAIPGELKGDPGPKVLADPGQRLGHPQVAPIAPDVEEPVQLGALVRRVPVQNQSRFLRGVEVHESRELVVDDAEAVARRHGAHLLVELVLVLGGEPPSGEQLAHDLRVVGDVGRRRGELVAGLVDPELLYHVLPDLQVHVVLGDVMARDLRAPQTDGHVQPRAAL